MSSAWARTWGRFTARAGYLNMASRAISDGDLQTAVNYAMQLRFDTSIAGRRLLQKLVESLIAKSREQIAAGQCSQAWHSLSSASEIALAQDRDRISREKNELVELTIDNAESLLVGGKIAHTIKVINELHSRHILDWRADRIRIAAEKIRDAEVEVAKGECRTAVRLLTEAKQLRPDLLIIDARIATCESRELQIKELTDQLQRSLMKADWTRVSQVCRQLLIITPTNDVALNAQRRLIDIRKKKTNAGTKKKTSYSKSSRTNNNRSPLGTTSIDSEEQRMSDDKTPSIPVNEASFMLWIDGVGGYLVCPATLNTIGQAVTYSNVQIPILGDIQRRHCRIETVDQDHMLQPFGNVCIDGKKMLEPTPLKNHQLIEFEGGVNLRYSKPHPLSGSARLEFQSRHRTQPWSDSVLLASGPIILGPNQRNHVFCPRWVKDLVIFRREGNWYARTQGKLEIDGQEYEKEGPLKLDSRIVGEEFTMSLEPVGL